MYERQIHNFFDRVFRFDAQPCDHALPADLAVDALFGEDPGEQLVGRHEIHYCKQPCQPIACRCVAFVCCCRIRQSLPQRHRATVVRQIEKVVIVKADQRSLQDDGEG